MIRKVFVAICTAFTLFIILLPQVVQAETRVVTSIKPIHGLVASIMDGIGQSSLIVKGYESVHDYPLKPSDAQMIEDADFIVWVGPGLETTISAAIFSLQKHGTSLELSEIDGLTQYKFRSSHIHDHNDHGHRDDDDHDDHGHDDDRNDRHRDDDHGHDGNHEDDHRDDDGHGDHEHDDDHDEGHSDDMAHEDGHDDHYALDMHIWLDVRNAKLMSKAIAGELAKIYPQSESKIHSNLSELLKNLHALEDELELQAKGLADKPYVVFHDAYQYLERWLNLDSVAAVTLNPEIMPGVRQIKEIREVVHRTGARCAFAEPQFNPGILRILQEDSDLKIGVLDPLGADVEPGPNSYFEIMRNIMRELNECLS